MKACPFCGARDENLSVYEDQDYPDSCFAVRCEGCGALGPWTIHETRAEALWDERSSLMDFVQDDDPREDR